jgi:hypothetical protein
MVMVATFPCMRYFPFTSPVDGTGTWFTYAVMQIFFGGFSGLDKPMNVDTSKVRLDKPMNTDTSKVRS